MLASVKSLEKTIDKKLVDQEKTLKNQKQVTANLTKELRRFEKQINKKLQSTINKANTLQEAATELTKVEMTLKL